MSDLTRFDRLTKRHRECLLGVRALQGSKEIADQLGIEKSTVDGYLTEAVRLLGAKNRRDAALLLAEHEASLVPPAPAPAPAPNVSGRPPPDKMGGDSARLAEPPPPLPSTASPGEWVAGQQDAEWRGRTPWRSGLRLPYRRKGQADNDLSIGDRLIWIQAIVVGSAIGFGMLAMGLQVVTTVIESVTRHLS